MPNEEGDVVKECKAMHEEEFWREVKKKDKQQLREKEEEKGEKEEEEKERKKRAKRRTGKRRCDGFVSVEAFEIFCQGRVAVMFPGKTSWRSLRTCVTVSLFLVSWCGWCLM